ncbi:stage VI sporulation protein D [Paenibacillus sp. UNCCL117]|uniref:LysM peptidoglycan-binding domain-containing protein n=1 Tax=Paenibacillus sp. UNCCL117 TaxID=1502764 RepID=UPI00088D8C4E|nr:LysM peptidoglycan-binding domain-containing protein [Paenibacillus sp. UNCCL117]SDD24887.1 stage VI sporulation protein D [Paenibacillus sp. cl123]SFW41382.1 stage VI sporulation protein D [Paenibacillus sp. UNCCL117]
MTTPSNGLRFDIYERVHVSDEVLGIKQLEGVELVPHIQVLTQGEQAVLRGNLLLNGSYVDELGRESQRLEHLIPVEITLPMNRVARVEEIAVEIENFDVDLLSPRSLNITGVLSLNGLEVNASRDEQEPSWRETEEEVVFVHEAANARTEAFDGDAQVRQRQEDQAAFQVPAADTAESFGSRLEEPPPQEVAEENEPEMPEDAEAAPLEEPVNDWQPQAEQAPEAEKKELKVGFGAKKAPAEEPPAAAADNAAPKPGAFGLASLINYSASKSEARAAEEAAQAQAAAEAASAQRMEWGNLLLSRRGDQQEFKKVRLVIVQKEDTLETIAKKYELNPRELVLYNRLGDNELAAGQIVYIPR